MEGTQDALVRNQDTEIKTLRRTLMVAENAQGQQNKVYLDVVNERVCYAAQIPACTQEITRRASRY